jgi:hypothetical protein
MTGEADGSENTDSNLTERFERGAPIADKHGMNDPLLALALQETLDALDASSDTRAAAFDLAATSAIEAHANGKSPTLVAAAIIYDSSVAVGTEHTQSVVARTVGQSREALSQHCRQLRTMLDTDAPATAEDAPST